MTPEPGGQMAAATAYLNVLEYLTDRRGQHRAKLARRAEFCSYGFEATREIIREHDATIDWVRTRILELVEMSSTAA